MADGRNEAALDLAQRALENATAHDQPELRWDAQTLVGIAQRRLHRPDEARKALTDAVHSIEQLSTEVAVSDNLRQRFFETKLSPYHELIALLVEQHRLATIRHAASLAISDARASLPVRSEEHLSRLLGAREDDL